MTDSQDNEPEEDPSAFEILQGDMYVKQVYNIDLDNEDIRTTIEDGGLIIEYPQEKTEVHIYYDDDPDEFDGDGGGGYRVDKPLN